MTGIWNDVRYAMRSFRNAPSIYSRGRDLTRTRDWRQHRHLLFLDNLLLRHIPARNPDQLVALKMEGSHYGSNSGMNAISYPMYSDFRDHNQVFSGMFCRFAIPASLGFGNRTERVNAELVSGTYFPVLGITAASGRIITPSDDRIPNGHPLAMLSYAFWRSRFGSDPKIIGTNVDHQRARPHRHWRSAARLRRHTAGASDAGLRPHHDEGANDAILGCAEGSPLALGQRVRPVKAGHQPRPGQNFIAAIYAQHAQHGGERGCLRARDDRGQEAVSPLLNQRVAGERKAIPTSAASWRPPCGCCSRLRAASC